jgi:hypothetical protein
VAAVLEQCTLLADLELGYNFIGSEGRTRRTRRTRRTGRWSINKTCNEEEEEEEEEAK